MFRIDFESYHINVDNVAGESTKIALRILISTCKRRVLPARHYPPSSLRPPILTINPEFFQRKALLALQNHPNPIRPAAMIDIKRYMADGPPTVLPLTIKPHFQALTEEQKLYAHYLSR